MSQKLLIQELPVQGQKILMRVDFNVPMDVNGNITDDTRIVSALPSIEYVLKNGGSVILMSHLGRPKGKIISSLSLAPCAKRLSALLNQPVLMAPDCIGSEVEKMAGNLKPGDVLLLENLRFHTAEEHPEKDPSFAEKLARLGDAYVNDAFGTAHRAHASTAHVAQFFPGKAVAGFLMEKEIRFLGNVIRSPERPFYAIIGGAKISTKLGVLKALRNQVDALFIGGGMAYTFLKAKGIDIGNSIHEDDLLDEAKNILKEYDAAQVNLFLPEDILVANKFSADANTQIVEKGENFPTGFEGVDIGPKTINKYTEELQNAKTVFWNGPLGVFEIEPFSKGTQTIAHTVANLNATTIVGGGDSVAAIQKTGEAAQISHLSTGGGASLEYIEFHTLPGIEALSDKEVLQP